jgi:hypothetical protein
MSEELLRELIAGQKEQTELIRRYLWRLRFSLLSLLLLTTATAVGLGIMAYNLQQPAIAPLPAPTGTWSSYPPPQLQIYTTPAPTIDDSLLKAQ